MIDLVKNLIYFVMHSLISSHVVQFNYIDN